MLSAVSSVQMSFCDRAAPAWRTSFIVYLNEGNSGIVFVRRESADYSRQRTRKPAILAYIPRRAMAVCFQRTPRFRLHRALPAERGEACPSGIGLGIRIKQEGYRSW